MNARVFLWPNIFQEAHKKPEFESIFDDFRKSVSFCRIPDGKTLLSEGQMTEELRTLYSRLSKEIHTAPVHGDEIDVSKTDLDQQARCIVEALIDLRKSLISNSSQFRQRQPESILE